MDDFLLEKDTIKDVSAHSFIQQKWLSPTLMELTTWGEIENNEIITQVNVKSQRSHKDAIRTHSGVI